MNELHRDLVAELNRGSGKAFEEVYDLYRARLYSFLVRLTGDTNVAQDLLQETWLRLARHATRLEPDTDLCAWLFTVGRNLYISYRRWQVTSRAVRAMTTLAHTQRPATPFEEALVSETQRNLEMALSVVAPIHREILLLVCTERFTEADAAHILGISPEAARKRLSRARAVLAQTLSEQRPIAGRKGEAA